MFRCQSAPGLGKGLNPLQGYVGDSRSLLTLSGEELEAERIYYAAISGLTKDAFTILAKDLTRRNREAGAYLTWLITCRGRQWPTVS